jgi:N-acetylglucosamine kinase-like BadF-type ATPase
VGAVNASDQPITDAGDLFADAPVIVAVDGGNSKTDVACFTLEGRLVAHETAGTSSPHQIGLDASLELLTRLANSARRGHPVAQANIYLAGLDFEHELADYRQALVGLDWASATPVIDNDIFALLRAGTSEPDAVAVVCGAGLNAVGRRADGATARFASLGTVSGDWGGGDAIGLFALWNAARGADLRGPYTELERAIPERFGVASVAAVTEAVHVGNIALAELGRLAPIVFSLATDGDEIARSIVERQANEIARMAASCIVRLGLDGAVPVVLGGGVLRSANPLLIDGLTSALAELAPKAIPILVATPPIVGAILLALESAGAAPDALRAAVREPARWPAA